MDNKLRILMLDDNAADAASIERELKKAGISFESLRVSSRPEYEESLNEFVPGLILSDYWLPSFDGVSALAVAQQSLPDVPFIFVSSALGEELAIDAMKNGATDYVLKVGLSRLVPAVRRALRETEERAVRKHAEEKLRESEERLKSILGAVATGVVIIDPATHKIVDANPAAVDMIGFPREGIVGQICHKFICDAPRGRCPVTDLGEDLDRRETVLLSAGKTPLPVLKTVTRVVLDGREHLLESFVDLSASKEMERALRESEGASRTLLNAPIGVVAMIDAKGQILAINETGAKKIGEPAADLIGEIAFEHMPPDVGGSRRKQLEKVVRTGVPARFEDNHDGAYYDNNFFPLFDEPGKVSRVVVFAQDITERKLVEVAQKKDRDFISKVLDTAGALVVVQERQSRIVLFNKTAETVTGYSFAEVRGKRPWDIMLGSAASKLARSIARRLTAGEDVEPYETVWRTKDGQDRNMAVHHALLLGSDGEVEYIITTATDVTESRMAEEALKESEERYRSVFESTGTAMCIVDGAAAITFANDEFEHVSGMTRAEAVGRKFTAFLDEAQASEFKSHCAELGHSGSRAGTPPVHFECTFYPRSGDALKMLANMGRLPGSAGTSAVSLIDVTREKAYEEDLRERAERLRDFLVVASHELRHPIAVVKGYANTLTEYMDRLPPELVREILADIDLSTERLTRYVEQLLDVSRVEQGRLFINRERVEPEVLLKMTLDDTWAMGFANQFLTSVAAGTGPVSVDSEKFVQLMHILVDNAIKFSPEGSPVEVEIERDETGVLVSVKDRGKGIPDEARQKIFDRFYQVEDALHHSKPGMGLGLYIASQIAEAHGGRIWVEPHDGGGSVFKFTIS
ncbi:MAG TPA: PAS domain S-box protein [Candidatus Anoxymicrobiaceae bacterium]